MIYFLDEGQGTYSKTYCLYVYDDPIHSFDLGEYYNKLESDILPGILNGMRSTIEKFPEVPIPTMINHLYIISLEDQVISQELTSELRKKVILALKKDERQRR